MPNHTGNRMTVSGSRGELARFISAITTKNEDGTIGYRIASLVPMPKELEGTQSPTPSSPEPHPNWANLLATGEITQEWHDELVASQVRKYEAGQKAKAETGFYNWYDWANAVWGTKWGDYDTDLLSDFTAGGEEVTFHYQTAWSPFSVEFLAKVSELFPTLTFEVEYEGEGTEYLGRMIAFGGNAQDFYDEPSPEAFPEFSDDNWDEYEEAMSVLREKVMSRLYTDAMAELTRMKNLA